MNHIHTYAWVIEHATCVKMCRSIILYLGSSSSTGSSFKASVEFFVFYQNIFVSSNDSADFEKKFKEYCNLSKNVAKLAPVICE